MIRYHSRRALEQNSQYVCLSCLGRLFARHGKQTRHLQIPRQDPALVATVQAILDERVKSSHLKAETVDRGPVENLQAGKESEPVQKVNSIPKQTSDPPAPNLLFELAQRRYQNALKFQKTDTSVPADDGSKEVSKDIVQQNTPDRETNSNPLGSGVDELSFKSASNGKKPVKVSKAKTPPPKLKRSFSPDKGRDRTRSRRISKLVSQKSTDTRTAKMSLKGLDGETPHESLPVRRINSKDHKAVHIKTGPKILSDLTRHVPRLEMIDSRPEQLQGPPAPAGLGLEDPPRTLSREQQTMPGRSIKEALLTPRSHTKIGTMSLERAFTPAASPFKADSSTPTSPKNTEQRIADMERLKSPIRQTDAKSLEITALNVSQPPVPTLSYGLDRVLFNPGVYQLQDPRSRVYNFDPYLQTIMPVSEFDFPALREFTTSSADRDLLNIAKAHGKRYIGSTSSMSSVLSHFHFLLSQWRTINAKTLSKEFPARLDSFTIMSRAPQSIFLKWQDGTYAIDADREFASTSILSLLGRSMEKLLTLDTKDYERYRKGKLSNFVEPRSDSFHYTTLGDFLMRSQLDAHDPRLPGTGMFDLKTRAVVAVRMDTATPDMGSGYEIKGRFGEWESFEREYHDMIRAALLKYSLQVRMGRMDGIFVAYHNTERIFGFQYLGLPELDLALHGQEETALGDQEFKFSLDLLNQVLNRATEKYPKQSLRIHFETREAQTTFMYAFAEPVTEDQLHTIQSRNDAKMAEVERDILGLDQEPEDLDDAKASGQWSEIQASVEKSLDNDEKSLSNSHHNLPMDETVALTDKSQEELGSQPLHDVVTEEAQSDEDKFDAVERAGEQASESKMIGEQNATEQVTDDGQQCVKPTEASVGSPNSGEATSLSGQAADGEEPSSAQPNLWSSPKTGARVGSFETDRDNAEGVTESRASYDSTVVSDAEADAALEARREDVQQVLSHQVEGQPDMRSQEAIVDANDLTIDTLSDARVPASSKMVDEPESEAEVQTAVPEHGYEKGIGLEEEQARIQRQADSIGRPSTVKEILETAEIMPRRPIEATEEIPVEEVATPPGHGDTTFLDNIVRESDEVQDTRPEVLGMVLTVRNKVNKNYVLRPKKFGPRDDWVVEYTLEDISSARAWPLYQACKLRRKKSVEMSEKTDEQAAADYYLQQMRQLSREGKRYRKQLDRADKNRPVVVYESLRSKANLWAEEEAEVGRKA